RSPAYPNPANRCPIWAKCSELRIAEHGLILPWVPRIRCGASIDCTGRSVLRGRSAHSRCNGHEGCDHDPMFHLSLLSSLSLALGRVTAKAGARRIYSSAVVEEQLRCRIRANAPGADPCRSAYEHKPVPFELGRREPDQNPSAGSGRSPAESLGATVEHDLPGVQFHAAPDNREAQPSRKSHENERRRQRNVGDPRNILLAAQQIEVIEPRACHPGLEFASRHNKQEIEGYSVQACLIIIGVDKGACAAPWHSFSLQVSWRKAADPGLGAGKRC